MVVSGAGEAAVRRLALADFAMPDGVSRVIRVPAPDFADIPLPYREADFKNLEHRYLYYESSRGCPFSCSYCLSSRDDHALQSKGLPAVRAEIGFLLLHRPALVKFVDRSFNAERARAREIWDFLAREHAGKGTLFHFEIYPALLEDEDFALLRGIPPGLFQFEIGIQSVHPRTLEAVNRPAAWDREKKAIHRLIEIGTIHLHVDLIVGLPFEGVDEVRQSFDEIVGLGAEHVQMGFLKGLPGTRLKEQAESFGMVFMREAPYEILRNAWLSVAQLAELKRIATLLDTIGNSRRYGAFFDEALRRHGGLFDAYRDLSAYCLKNAFDIRTRNEAKVRALLESWNKEET